VAAAVGRLDPVCCRGYAVAGDNKVYSASIQSIKESCGAGRVVN
jgi:hypothetical protein